MLEAWELTVEDEAWHGFCSLVLPVVTAREDRAVLKIGLPDDESEHEHLVLQRWRGRGAVRLLRSDPSRRAVLLERLDRHDLSDHWDVEACEIVAGLYRILHVPVMPQLRTQASYVARWAAALAADAKTVPVPRRMVDQALALARDLCAEPATAVIHGDLHYGNVLLGERGGEERWLAIDPKPTNGDPHYELLPMLGNRFEDYTGPGTTGSARDGIRRRFHTLLDAADLDEGRARGWVIVRSILRAHWVHGAAVGAGREPTAREQDHITRCIMIAKAVQD
ncbi:MULTISPECIES: aminoglycoside phosphotransferase family protein [Nocardioides]|uniref:Aminoglycoside phosphotransferase family protein n=1 Tax=Nocardioides vastitatis TaxID=2568655 RepID=A0ABW0ZMC5_9ACTN|nr:aminoglycoside phosphotransferase family protein [Nocardioides sp.]